MKTYSRHDFTREERAARAKVAISAAFESKEQAFLDFVLSHYVRVGVQELDQEKLTPFVAVEIQQLNAVAHLGKPEDIHDHLRRFASGSIALLIDAREQSTIQ